MHSGFLSLQKFLLKGIGFSFNAGISFFQNPLLSIAGYTSMCTIIIAMAAYIYENFDDLEKVTDALTLLLQGTTSSLKAISFVFYRERFRKLYYKLDDINKSTQVHFKSSVKNIKFFNDKAVYMSTAYVWSCFIAGSTAQLIPLIKSTLMWLRSDGHFEKLLPYLAV